ncbi:MAG: preprotein translocase subunit YajC [Lachnospiraceae bacterium]|nr:preprotein translocase subunit YajC [Lachnospiraceae bacterium]
MNPILLTAAEGAGMNSTAGIVTVVLYVVAIGAFMYLVMIRPQKKEQNRMNQLLSTLEVGDSVLTTSGFYGVVIDVSDDDDTVIVEFGSNKNCRIPMKKEAITQIEKPESASSSSDDDKKDKK